MKNPRYINLLLIFIGFIIAILIGEVGLRIFYPQNISSVDFVFAPRRWTIPIPNQCGKTELPGIYSYEWCNNSLGLRGKKEYSYQKKDFRILLLGDSFTYGVGVNDDQAFAAVLQNHILKDKKAIEIINAGNGVKGTGYALKFFQVYGHRYQPDITA